jgi:hypothetical protein
MSEDELKAENERLRVALKFYANGWTKNKGKWYDVTLVEDCIVPSADLLNDEGELAKEALA